MFIKTSKFRKILGLLVTGSILFNSVACGNSSNDITQSALDEREIDITGIWKGSSDSYEFKDDSNGTIYYLFGKGPENFKYSHLRRNHGTIDIDNSNQSLEYAVTQEDELLIGEKYLPDEINASTDIHNSESGLTYNITYQGNNNDGYCFKEDLTGIFYFSEKEYSFKYTNTEKSGTIVIDYGEWDATLNYCVDGDGIIVGHIYSKDDKSANNENSTTQETTNAIVDGLRFDKVYVTSSPYSNIGLGITNTSGSDKELDISKIVIKKDGKVLKHNLHGNKSYPNGKYKCYAQQTEIEENGATLNVGDTVSIYYDSCIITTVTVEKL